MNKLKSSNGKVLLENFISLSALQLAGILLPLITLPYVLRTIGFDKYGLIVFSASLVTYFTSLTDFSFQVTATRDVAVFRNSPKKLDIIYSKVLIIKVFFLLISWGIIGTIVCLVPSFYEYWYIYLYTGISLLGQVLFPEWFFQGIEKMRYITYLNLGIKLFFTLCIFLFIKKESDYWIYPLLQSMGFIGAGIVGQYLLVTKYNLKFVRVSFKSLISTVKSNTSIFISRFVPTLYLNTTVFTLGFFVDKASLGVFNSIRSINTMQYSILGSLTTAFFPFIVREKHRFNLFLKIAIVLVLSMIVGSVIAKPLIYWYINLQSSEYDFMYYILLVGLFYICIERIFSTNFLLPLRKDKEAMKITLIASIIGFLMLYPLIKYFGINGGAIVISTSQTIMGLGSFFYYLKFKK
ncbi:oligosaccharide flippase family protein [Capnocytophaga felis]|nr:oligosaccharide flippase family protein [Capnocytophaga felis]